VESKNKENVRPYSAHMKSSIPTATNWPEPVHSVSKVPLEPSKKVQKTKLIKYPHNMNTKDEVARALDPTLMAMCSTIDVPHASKAAGLSSISTDRQN
jgi:hypothetical protein